MITMLIIAAAVTTLVAGGLIGYFSESDSKGLTYLLAIVASIVVGGVIVSQCISGVDGGGNGFELLEHLTMYSAGLLPLILLAVAIIGALVLVAIMFASSLIGYLIGTALKPK